MVRGDAEVPAGVAAVRTQPVDGKQRFNPAPRAGAADEHHKIDGLSHEPAVDRDGRFLDQLFEAGEAAAAAELAWSVASPPGWPVFHAFTRARASGPRTSPTTIRSGRSPER